VACPGQRPPLPNPRRPGLPRPTPSRPAPPRSYGFVSTVSSAVCLLAMLPFLYMDVCTLIAYSSGWASSPWNL
jgi:hypothetical protein